MRSGLPWIRGNWKKLRNSRYTLKIKPADELDGDLGKKYKGLFPRLWLELQTVWRSFSKTTKTGGDMEGRSHI